MFIIRKAQVAAMAQAMRKSKLTDAQLVPVLIKRLQGAGTLAKKLADPKPSQAAVLAAVRFARAHGVVSEDGCLRAAAFSIALGPAWLKTPGVAAALATTDDETTRLNRVQSILLEQ